MWAAPIGRGGLSVVDIKCSRCGGHATFDGELFEFYPVHKKLPAEIADSGKAIYQWSGSYVIEHYPNLVKWANSLRKLPKEFISAKVRDLVIKQISTTLEHVEKRQKV